MTSATSELATIPAEEQTFVDLVAKGFSYTQAYLRSFPVKCQDLAYGTIRNNAWQLMTKHDIVTSVEVRKLRLAQVADKAINRLEEVITDGKEHNAVSASIFVYEQEHGKARQVTEVIGKHVMVTYDLSGGTAGPVPQEILDQLKDDPTDEQPITTT